MTKRIAAITFIWLCTAIAWIVLGGTIFLRTQSSDAELRQKVAAIWGAPHLQQPPAASYQVVRPTPIWLPLESSRIDTALNLEYRQKGLLWYSTYKVDFAGTYTFRNTSAKEQNVTFELPFPAQNAVYDNVQLFVDNVPLALTSENASTSGAVRIGPGQIATLRVSYRSQGLDTWQYRLGGEVAQARDFELRVRTNFRDIDFPNTLSPTEKKQTPNGWDLTWKYQNLVTGVAIGVQMPGKLQPGPLAGQISYFAPVSLFFFFFLMFIITTIRGIELHPMNYFFLAAAFFSFHLLLAYLADHISIHAAFAISAAVSVFLVISYLRLVTGFRFAAVEAGITQVVYLVLFSYAFFFEGFTGLAVTIGSILTLFVVMQMTGRTRWSEKFASAPQPLSRPVV